MAFSFTFSSMKNYIATALSFGLLSLFPLMGFTQKFEADFWTKIESEDTTGLLMIVKQWEAKHPNDPEMFVAYANYHGKKAFRELVQMTTEKPEGVEFMELTDSLGNQGGYLHSEMIVNDSSVQTAVRYLDKAISLFPNRLDFRLGKIFLTRESEHWDWMETEIVATLQQSMKLEHRWKTEHNEKIKEAQPFLYSSLQETFYVLFESGLPYAYDIIERSSRLIIQQQDQNVIALSNIATCLMMKEKHLDALTYLNKAYQISPNDIIIVGNEAFCHWRLGHFEDAKRFYKIALEMAKAQDDAEQVLYYEEQIQEMDQQIDNK
jgi:tetratricopeptide (TPR) repeat protein